MKKYILLFLLLIIPKVCEPAVPVTFTNGTVASATEVNQNFNYFENKFSLTSGHDHDGIDSKSTTGITGVGTIVSGTWQGTIIDEVYGGTGLQAYASGDLIYATSDSVLARLAKPSSLGSTLLFGTNRSEPEWLVPGTTGQILVAQGTDLDPAWTTVGATKAYLTIASQDDIANNTPTKVLLNGESFDTASEFASSTFTAARTGYFQVVGSVGWKDGTTTADKKYDTQVFKNGALEILSIAHSSDGTKDLTTVASGVVFLNAGEYLELYAHHEDGGATVDIATGATTTFLSVIRIK